jgi:hypothetical protein
MLRVFIGEVGFLMLVDILSSLAILYYLDKLYTSAEDVSRIVAFLITSFFSAINDVKAQIYNIL